MDIEGAHTRALTWEHTGDAEEPWQAEVNGACWRIRVGDFPAEALYTLLVDDEEVLELDEWPDAWTRGPREGSDQPNG